MSDDTTAALQALLQQVQTLTTTVTDQAKRLDDLHAFNSRVLDEKKDMQRQLEAAAPKKKTLSDIVNEETQERKMRAANLEKGDDGNWYPQGVRPKHSITRADARNPQKYRAAKEAAEKAGATLTVLDDGDGDPTRRNTQQAAPAAKLHTVTLDDEHNRVRYVHAEHNTGKGLVHRRLQAESEGYTTRTFRTADELPQHMQTKLRMMENAANASDS